MNINSHILYMLPSIDIAVMFGTTTDQFNTRTYYELKGIYLPADNHVTSIGDIAVKTYFSTCVMPLVTGKMSEELYDQTDRSLRKLLVKHDFFNDMFNSDIDVNEQFAAPAGIDHFGNKVIQNDFKKIAAKLALYFIHSFMKTKGGYQRYSDYYDGCAYIREFSTYNEAMAHMQLDLVNKGGTED